MIQISIMSRAVQQHNVGEHDEGESAGAEGLKNIVKNEEKKVIHIEGKDLAIVQNACCIKDRAQAIELISSVDGDIKKALEKYVTE